MTLVPDRQSSFAAGELTPDVHGRVDVARVASGCRVAKNFFVGPQGQLMSRPGTELVSTFPGVSAMRLVPFLVDTDEHLVVALANVTNVGFFRRDNGRSAMLTEFPFGAFGSSNLPGLRWSQVGDSLIIVDGVGYPTEIRRTSVSPLEWDYDSLDFAITAFQVESGIPYITDSETESPTEPAYPWSWKVTRVIQETQVVSGRDRIYESRAYQVDQTMSNWNTSQRRWHVWSTEWTSPRLWLNGTYYWYPERPNNWYLCTHTHYSSENRGFPHLDPTYWTECPWNDPGAYAGIVFADVAAEYPVYPDKPVRIDWPTLPTSFGTVGKVLETRIYRGQDKLFGLVGTTEGSFFVDEGKEPDWAIGPPGETYLFPGWDTKLTGETAEQPSVVTHAQGRRWFGGSAENQATLYGSALEEFQRFDRQIRPQPTSAMRVTQLSSRREIVRAIIESRGILVFTNVAVRVLRGYSSSILLADEGVSAERVVPSGCGTLEPLLVGDSVWFLDAEDVLPQAFAALIESGGDTYQDLDVNAYWRHLFAGHTIVDWCWAQRPWRLVWVVRDDGVLLSCTFNRVHELTAWTRHELAGGGLVKSIATIPEETEDAVYMAVLRGSTMTVERLTTRELDGVDVRAYIGVDCAVWHDGRNTATTTVTAIAETDPALIAQGYTTRLQWSACVASAYVGKSVRVHGADGGTILVYCVMEKVPGDGLYYCTGDDVIPADIVGVAVTTWGVCTTALEHDSLAVLDGQEVRGLSDGYVIGPLTVAGGHVILPSPMEVGCLGLSYDCDFESLSLATERLRQKNTSRVGVEYSASRGGLVGESLDADDEWRATDLLDGRPMQKVPTRKVSAGYGFEPLATDIFIVSTDSRWGKHGRVAFRQEDPLPTTLVAVTREVDVGG